MADESRHAAYSQVQCPSCGNDSLPEFFVPVGMALCPRCRILLRRSSRGLTPVGRCSESLVLLVNERMRGDDIVKQEIQETIAAVLADRLGAGKFLADLGADSLDDVELIMALEEEFGVELDVP